MIQAGRFGAVILAAGAGSRFGGRKLLTPLDGRPLLDHVLDAVRSIGPAETVVVLGHEADDVVASISWSGERRVVNPEPDRGLSSSLQVGFAALGDGTGRDELDGVFVVLGDQPLVDPAVFRALAQAEVRAGTAFVAPRYHAGGANPVLVLRPGRPWIAEATGRSGPRTDPGRPSGARRGGRARWHEPGRRHPGATWPRSPGPIASDGTGSRSIVIARCPTAPTSTARSPASSGLIRGGPTSRSWTRCSGWPSHPMRGSTSAPERAATRCRWRSTCARSSRSSRPTACGRRSSNSPPSTGSRASASSPSAGRRRPGPRPRRYASTSRSSPTSATTSRRSARSSTRWRRRPGGCAWRSSWTAQPSSVADPFWPPIHGEERIRLPALDALVDLLAARGRAPSVARFDRAPRRFASFDDLHGFIRRQLWLAAGGAKDRQLAGLLRASGRGA